MDKQLVDVLSETKLLVEKTTRILNELNGTSVSSDEKDIQTHVIAIINWIMDQSNHAELYEWISRQPYDVSYRECWMLIMECETEIHNMVSNMKRNMDWIDSLQYENQIMQGISNAIQTTVARVASTHLAIVFRNFMNAGWIPTQYLRWICDEIVNILISNKNIPVKPRCSGSAKTIPKLLDRKHKHTYNSSTRQKMMRGHRKHGKAIVNRWRKLNHDRDWTIGFTRQKLYNRLILAHK